MPRKKIILPPADSPEALRLIVENALNTLASESRDIARTSPLDFNNYRATNLARPAAKTDGVNVAFLQESLRALESRILTKTRILIENPASKQIRLFGGPINVTANPTYGVYVEYEGAGVSQLGPSFLYIDTAGATHATLLNSNGWGMYQDYGSNTLGAVVTLIGGTGGGVVGLYDGTGVLQTQLDYNGLDCPAYAVGGTAGASGTFSTSVTVVNGLVTAGS